MAGRLPGMEDSQIEALEELAADYKKIQKRRMTALAKEVELKDKIMAAMKEAKKRKYKYGEVEIEIVATKEKVKVKLAKEDEDESGEE